MRTLKIPFTQNKLEVKTPSLVPLTPDKWILRLQLMQFLAKFKEHHTNQPKSFYNKLLKTHKGKQHVTFASLLFALRTH